MKKLISALFLSLALSSGVMANEDVRADLLRAQALINSALAKLDYQDYSAVRVVKNAQYICRETATTDEVLQAIVSAKKEVQAKCGGRCAVVVEFSGNKGDCFIQAKAIR